MRHIDEDTVIIVSTSIDKKQEDVFKSLNDDQILIDAINEYKKMLSEDNIEIFKEKHNILITEKGYYLAIYVKDVNKIVENK